ncbi:hypothetical protein JCGZ_14182 [Jatropha curcas]|uniref:RRM domain-containing protein n=1 Tax=Jatropha curcas TaxID=180498 RepID=A0A067JWQ8_JATCU|nr:28 kDa ribonucleoprotein, chloroplastic [Jatropha curcas]KDP28411.1 hypothetical protein JCGZ_14182 [Jatropha curcas]
MAAFRCLVPSLPSMRTASLASTPLHPLIQVQSPKFSCLSHLHCHDTLVSSLSSLQWPPKGRRVLRTLAVVDEESVVAEEIDREENVNKSQNDYADSEWKKEPKPCELYVCNLPRSYDISELVEMFRPYGTVISVEVSRNPETGVSRGCGYLTLDSINSAKKAIAALDRSDVGGREMRVKFSVAMSPSKRNPEGLTSTPLKTVFYESPHKLYIGNLAWTIIPEELRNQFSKFGTVVSTRVLYDRKGGKTRAYAFLSFASAAVRDAALCMNGALFHGRILVVRRGVERDD